MSEWLRLTPACLVHATFKRLVAIYLRFLAANGYGLSFDFYFEIVFETTSFTLWSGASGLVLGTCEYLLSLGELCLDFFAILF